MEQRDKLKAWMNEKGYTHNTFAHDLDVTENYVYKLLAGSKPLGNGFEFRFLKRFGAAEHNKIFGAIQYAPPSEKAAPVAVS